MDKYGVITVRGATTVRENTKDEILTNTRKLIEMIFKKNKIEIEDVISIIFTATDDIDDVYPAVAARELGFTQCSLMCFQEMKVRDSLNKCIRVLIFFNSEKKQSEVTHVYLNEAKSLRPDLTFD